MSHVLPQKIKPCIVRFISPSLSNQRLPYDSLLLALFCICQDRNKTSLLPPMHPPPLRPLVGKLFSATGTLGLQVRMPRDFGAPHPCLLSQRSRELHRWKKLLVTCTRKCSFWKDCSKSWDFVQKTSVLLSIWTTLNFGNTRVFWENTVPVYLISSCFSRMISLRLKSIMQYKITWCQGSCGCQMQLLNFDTSDLSWDVLGRKKLNKN